MQLAAAGGTAPRFKLTTGRNGRRWHGEGGLGALDGEGGAADATEEETAEGDVLDLVPCYDLVRRAVRCVGIAPEASGGGGMPWSAERLEEARRCIEIGVLLCVCVS